MNFENINKKSAILKQKSSQLEIKTITDNDQLDLFTEEVISNIISIGMFQIFQMDIEQLKKFKNGLQIHYKQDRILISIIQQLILRKQKSQQEDKQRFRKMSIKEQNQLILWTKNIKNQFFDRMFGPDRSQWRIVAKRKLKCGLRIYFNQQICFYEMVCANFRISQTKIQNKNSQKIVDQQQQWAKRQITFIENLPFSFESSSLSQLKRLRECIQKFFSNEELLKRIIQKFIESKQQRRQVLNFQKNDSLEMLTKRTMLQFIQFPQKFDKKSQSFLNNLKIGIEKYFKEEVTILSAVQKLILKKTMGNTIHTQFFQKIYRIQNPTTSNLQIKSQNNQTIFSSFSKKLQAGISSIFNVKVFRQDKQSQKQSLHAIQYLNKEQDQQAKQKKSK